MITFGIRPATESDSELLAGLIRRAFLDVALQFGLTPENCPTHPSNYSLERIQQDFSKGIVYHIIEVDGQGLGCVAFEQPDQDTLYLERLAVIPEARRQGLGKALVQHVFQIAADKGVKDISIAIIAQHTDLKRWYETLGFSFVKTKHFEHLPFDVTFMRHRMENGQTPV